MISVCIATYNGAKYIHGQIVSILRQLSEYDEIIVSDDNSNDDTIKIIEGIQDSRIKIFRHLPSDGSSFRKAKCNFENALKKASGEYIFMADQDDIWCINKVDTMMPLLKRYGCVQHGKFELIESTKEQYASPKLNQHNLMSGLLSMHFAGCCMGVTREYLNKALPIPKNVLTHDGWLACFALSFGTYHYIDERLIIHRIHDRNVSTNTNNSLLFRIKYRLVILLEIIKRRIGM